MAERLGGAISQRDARRMPNGIRASAIHRCRLRRGKTTDMAFATAIVPPTATLRLRGRATDPDNGAGRSSFGRWCQLEGVSVLARRALRQRNRERIRTLRPLHFLAGANQFDAADRKAAASCAQPSE